jgi:hypothetical protein
VSRLACGRTPNSVEAAHRRGHTGAMTHRGPRSVPALLFVFLALLDLTVLFPGAGLVFEPAAAFALLGAVVCAATHVRKAPSVRRRPDGVAMYQGPGGGTTAVPAVIPMPRRADVATRLGG